MKAQERDVREDACLALWCLEHRWGLAELVGHIQPADTVSKP